MLFRSAEALEAKRQLFFPALPGGTFPVVASDTKPPAYEKSPEGGMDANTKPQKKGHGLRYGGEVRGSHAISGELARGVFEDAEVP